jgi:hypothetical protein
LYFVRDQVNVYDYTPTVTQFRLASRLSFRARRFTRHDFSQ